MATEKQIEAACNWLNERTGKMYIPLVQPPAILEAVTGGKDIVYKPFPDSRDSMALLLDACTDDEIIRVGRYIQGVVTNSEDDYSLPYRWETLRLKPAVLFAAWASVCIPEAKVPNTEDATTINRMIYLNGSKSSFRCDCGCNVFRNHIPGDKTRFQCNSCEATFTGEAEAPDAR